MMHFVAVFYITFQLIVCSRNIISKIYAFLMFFPCVTRKKIVWGGTLYIHPWKKNQLEETLVEGFDPAAGDRGLPGEARQVSRDPHTQRTGRFNFQFFICLFHILFIFLICSFLHFFKKPLKQKIKSTSLKYKKLTCFFSAFQYQSTKKTFCVSSLIH